ncbi:hypothetical protein L209DRAFT_491357 [Thermothelomyces heterothallicus CBS 203.75]
MHYHTLHYGAYGAHDQNLFTRSGCTAAIIQSSVHTYIRTLAYGGTERSILSDSRGSTSLPGDVFACLRRCRSRAVFKKHLSSNGLLCGPFISRFWEEMTTLQPIIRTPICPREQRTRSHRAIPRSQRGCDLATTPCCILQPTLSPSNSHHPWQPWPLPYPHLGVNRATPVPLASSLGQAVLLDGFPILLACGGSPSLIRSQGTEQNTDCIRFEHTPVPNYRSTALSCLCHP